jgi:glycosyltransferase involved in cell wall biosynthesis
LRSRNEGFKILQYMGVGVPVTASPVGINTALIRHGETGFLAADARAWQRAPVSLATDRSLRQRMGTVSSARVVARFSRARHNTAAARRLEKVAAA